MSFALWLGLVGWFSGERKRTEHSLRGSVRSTSVCHSDTSPERPSLPGTLGEQSGPVCARGLEVHA